MKELGDKYALAANKLALYGFDVSPANRTPS